jgi:hypothetical protein
MKCWKGHFFNLLVCPCCHGRLIKYHQWLVCRVDKLGFLIEDTFVDFSIRRAHRFDIDEIKKMR